MSGFIIHPADTDIFKTSSGRLKKVTTSYDQTRRPQDVWQKTSYLRLLEHVGFTSSWRRRIYDVLRRLICNILKTSILWRLEDVWFRTSWRRRICDVLRTSVERRLCSNVVAMSTQRRNKWFFLILYCLKYSKNCFCLG